jgi:hypothetical protein
MEGAQGVWGMTLLFWKGYAQKGQRLAAEWNAGRPDDDYDALQSFRIRANRAARKVIV